MRLIMITSFYLFHLCSMCSDRGETAPRVGGQSPTESIFVSQPPQPLQPLSTTTPPCNNHHDQPSAASTNNNIPTTHSWTFFNYATTTAYQHRQCHRLPICFFGWAGLSIPTSSVIHHHHFPNREDLSPLLSRPPTSP